MSRFAKDLINLGALLGIWAALIASASLIQGVMG